MNNEQRIKIEQRIVRKYVRVLLEAGYQISGSCEGEALFAKCAVMPRNDDLFACDELNLRFSAEGKPGGFLYFVFGNSPDEVLCDYGGKDLDAIAELIAPADAYAQKQAA